MKTEILKERNKGRNPKGVTPITPVQNTVGQYNIVFKPTTQKEDKIENHHSGDAYLKPQTSQINE